MFGAVWAFVKKFFGVMPGTPVFDPDKSILALDKLQHLVGGFLVCLVLGFWPAVGACVVFEVGQWDVARGLTTTKTNGGTQFLPGYGIGLLDIAAGVLGAACWLAFVAWL
jgi:hypothetical protein